MRAVDDGLAVDRVGDRLTHLQLVERRLLVVGRQDRLALGAADQDLEARIALELVEVGAAMRGNTSTSPASSAAVSAAGSVMNLNVACLIAILRRVAVAVPGVERRRRAFVPGGELVGAGADRAGSPRWPRSSRRG